VETVAEKILAACLLAISIQAKWVAGTARPSQDGNDPATGSNPILPVRFRQGAIPL
jgi:hypothetical protein